MLLYFIHFKSIAIYTKFTKLSVSLMDFSTNKYTINIRKSIRKFSVKQIKRNKGKK